MFCKKPGRLCRDFKRIRGEDDPLVLNGYDMGAVLDQLIKAQKHLHIDGLAVLSAKIGAALGKDLCGHMIVVDRKIKGAVGIAAAHVVGGGKFLAKGDAHFDAVMVMGEQDLL